MDNQGECLIPPANSARRQRFLDEHPNWKPGVGLRIRIEASESAAETIGAEIVKALRERHPRGL